MILLSISCHAGFDPENSRNFRLSLYRGHYEQMHFLANRIEFRQGFGQSRYKISYNAQSVPHRFPVQLFISVAKFLLTWYNNFGFTAYILIYCRWLFRNLISILVLLYRKGGSRTVRLNCTFITIFIANIDEMDRIPIRKP